MPTTEAMKEIEILMKNYGAENVFEAVGKCIAKRVKKKMTCFLTGKPLAHEALCLYCGRCPAGRWFKVEMEARRP